MSIQYYWISPRLANIMFYAQTNTKYCHLFHIYSCKQTSFLSQDNLHIYLESQFYNLLKCNIYAN